MLLLWWCPSKMKYKKWPTLQFIMTDQKSLLSLLILTGRSIPLVSDPDPGSTFFGSWIRIRILLEMNCWIRILTEVNCWILFLIRTCAEINTNLKHCHQLGCWQCFRSVAQFGCGIAQWLARRPPVQQARVRCSPGSTSHTYCKSDLRFLYGFLKP